MTQHGTRTGYDNHRYLNEPACQPCRDYYSQYIRAWRIAHHKIATAQVPVTQLRDILTATPELHGLITRTLGPQVVAAIEAL